MANETFNKSLQNSEIEERKKFYDEILGQEPVNQIQPTQATAKSSSKPVESNEEGVVSTVATGVKSGVKGVAGGIFDAAGNLIESVEMLTNWVANNKTKEEQFEILPEIKGTFKLAAKYLKEDGSTVNQLTHDVTEFLIGFIPAMKGVNVLTKASGAAKATTAVGKISGSVGKSLAGGSVASATTVTPETQNLSNLVKTLGVENELINYLAIDPSKDSVAEMKAKQVLDNALFGIVSDTAIEALGYAFKGFKAKKIKEGKTPEQVADEVLATSFDMKIKTDEIIKNNEKEIVAEKLKQIDEFSKISENNPLMADYQKSLAAKENKLFIAEVLTKENPTDEEIDKLSKIFEDIDEQSIQSVDKMVELKNYIKSEKDAGRNEIEALRAKRLNKIKALEEEAKRFEDELKFFEENLGSEDLIRARTQEQNINIAKKQLEEKIAAKQEQILIAKDEAERFKEFANKEKLIKEIAKSDLLTKEEKRYFDNIISQEAEVAAKNADAEFAATKEMYNIAEETNFIEKNLNDYVRSNRAELSKGINDTLDNLKSKLSTVKVGKNIVVDNAVKDIKDVAKYLNVELDENVLRNAIETIKESDTKQITESLINSVEDTLKTATENKMRTSFKNQGGFASGQMLAQMGGAGIGAIGGAQTIDENDSNAEKIIKILGGAGAGIFGTAAVNRYLNKKMTKEQVKVFEEQNPTISAISKVDSIIKNPKVKNLTPEEKMIKLNELSNKSVPNKTVPSITSDVSKEEIKEMSDKFISGDYTKLTIEDFEKEGVFQNLKYVETNEDLDKLLLQGTLSLEKSINKTKVGDIGNQLTGVRTWEEAIEKSESFKNINSVNKLFSNTVNLDSRVQAARLMLSASGLRIQKIIKEISELENGISLSGTFKGDSALIKSKYVELNNAMEIHRGLTLKTTAASSEIGRALNIHKAIIKQEEMLKVDLDNMISKLGGSKELKAKSDLLKGLEHPAQMSTAITMSNYKVLNALLYARITGLLSSPVTHSVNIVGNVLNNVFTVGEKYTKAGYASINNKLTNKVVDYSLADANAYSFGMVKGLFDGIGYVFREQKFGEDFYKSIAGNQNFNIKEISGQVGEAGFIQKNPIGDLVGDESKYKHALNWIGSVMDVPLRFMGATDTAFQAITFRASISEQAFKKAKAEGLSGEDLTKRIADLMNDPPESFVIKAENDGLASTYQTALDKTEGKSFIDGVANIIQYGKSNKQNSTVGFLFNVVFPFVKTPTNIFKQSFQRIPLLNMLVERSDENSLKALIGTYGKEKQIEAQARFTSGLLFITAGIALLDYGIIEEQNNGKNFVIKAGDRTIDLAKIEPFGTLLGFGSMIKNSMNKLDKLKEVDPLQADDYLQDMAVTVAASMFQYTANKSYVRGGFELTSMMADVMNGKDKSTALSNFFDNTAVSFMPMGSALNWTRNLTDDRRQAEGIMQKIINKIPLASKVLDEKLDMITGEQLLSDATTGFAKKVVKEQVLDEIERLDVRLDLPKNIKGVKITGEQKNRLVEIATKEIQINGMSLKEILEYTINSPDYEDMVDGVGEFKSYGGTKSKTLNDIINAYYKAAEEQLIGEEDEIQEKLKLKEINTNNYFQGYEFLNSLDQ